MRTELVCLFSVVVFSGACRSGDNPVQDLSSGDQAVTLPDLSHPDLTGADLTSADLLPPPDLIGADLIMPDMYAPPFKTLAPYSVDKGPLYLVSADLDGDGNRDLVIVAGNATNGVTPSSTNVLLGKGDGTFNKSVTIAISPGPYSVALAQLDGDTKIDALVSEYDGFDILHGDGKGGFTYTAATDHYLAGDSTAALRGAVVVDLDGDGHLDVVQRDIGKFSVMQNGVVWVTHGSASGFVSGSATSFAISSDPMLRAPVAIGAGDVDGDGKVDILTGNITSVATTNTFSILRNTSVSGTISFDAAAEIPTGASPTAVLVADLDGTNHNDVIVIAADDNAADVHLSNTVTVGTATYAALVPYTVQGDSPQAAVLADMDSDGKTDLVVASGNGDNVTVLYGNGAGVFNFAHGTLAGSEAAYCGSFPSSIVADTFNADAKLDIAVADQGSDSVGVLINNR